jgi:hypothetical protein
LDTAFLEDDHPWIETDPNGMFAVLLLRRMAYTLMALFLSVSLRAKQTPRWRDLLRRMWTALVAATEEQLEALRPRRVLAVWS